MINIRRYDIGLTLLFILLICIIVYYIITRQLIPMRKRLSKKQFWLRISISLIGASIVMILSMKWIGGW